MTVLDMKRWASNNHFVLRAFRMGGWGATLYTRWPRGTIGITAEPRYATKGNALRGLARLFTTFLRETRFLP